MISITEQAANSYVQPLSDDEVERRTGILIRNGREVFYCILGRCMYEAGTRQEVRDTLNRYAHKLGEWDKVR
jgi:hypothetical protein